MYSKTSHGAKRNRAERSHGISIRFGSRLCENTALLRNVGTHRTLGRVLLGQFMRYIRYAMIFPSTTIVKVIAVQIAGLLAAKGGGG
jgi:hypothetical protein